MPYLIFSSNWLFQDYQSLELNTQLTYNKNLRRRKPLYMIVWRKYLFWPLKWDFVSLLSASRGRRAIKRSPTQSPAPEYNCTPDLAQEPHFYYFYNFYWSSFSISVTIWLEMSTLQSNIHNWCISQTKLAMSLYLLKNCCLPYVFNLIFLNETVR